MNDDQLEEAQKTKQLIEAKTKHIKALEDAIKRFAEKGRPIRLLIHEYLDDDHYKILFKNEFLLIPIPVLLDQYIRAAKEEILQLEEKFKAI